MQCKLHSKGNTWAFLALINNIYFLPYVLRHPHKKREFKKITKLNLMELIFIIIISEFTSYY
jgi:hypothetical protein